MCGSSLTIFADTYISYLHILREGQLLAHQLLHLALEPTKLITQRTSLSLTQMETTRTPLFSTSKTKLSTDAKCSVLLTSKLGSHFIVCFSHTFFWHSNVMMSYKDKDFPKLNQMSKQE